MKTVRPLADLIRLPVEGLVGVVGIGSAFRGWTVKVRPRVGGEGRSSKGRALKGMASTYRSVD